MAKTFDKTIDSTWTLFLDRDGVINHKIESDYVKSPSEFRLLPKALDALSNLRPLFGRIVVVTNQQGIGKELMTHEDLNRVHTHFIEVLNAVSVTIDQIYYCPHLAVLDPPCRKPNPGMAFQAKEDFPEINFRKSIMVGDSDSDIGFGVILNMTTVKISPIIDEKADYTHPSLYDFSQYVINSN